MIYFHIRFSLQVGLLFLVAILVLPACGSDFLEAKPNSSLLVPDDLDDCQKLLDNTAILNSNMQTLGILASDDYYIRYPTWQSSAFLIARNSYIWADDIYEGMTSVNEWNVGFQAVFYSNAVINVLNGLDNSTKNKEEWKNLMGMALFYRAYWYFSMAESFTMPYDPISAEQTLGLPLRRSPNIDEIMPRSSLKETYDFIVQDLKTSTELLSNPSPTAKLNRPSRAAAYAALARIYLVMADFNQALEYTEKSLALYDQLLDYNNAPITTNNPFTSNPELVFHSMYRPYDTLNPAPSGINVFVLSSLYGLYDEDDLRRQAFYTGSLDTAMNRKYLYSDNGSRTQLFAGIATDEIYLVKAECQARTGLITESMQTLDQLLVKRYKSGEYKNKVASSQQEAISIILNERRKELVFRGTRWSDVRRLNVLGANITLQRVLNGETYVLEPGNPKFAFPIPDSEINAGGLEQNPR